MKPLFILMTVVSSFFASTSKANNEIVSPQALQSFNRSFAGAREVSWTQEAQLYKVSFQVSGQYATAFYDADGELVVVTRNISPLQLPVVLLAAVKKDYAQQWISGLMEVSDGGGTYYYMTLEDADQKIILKSDGATKWVRFQKTEK